MNLMNIAYLLDRVHMSQRIFADFEEALKDMYGDRIAGGGGNKDTENLIISMYIARVREGSTLLINKLNAMTIEENKDE